MTYISDLPDRSAWRLAESIEHQTQPTPVTCTHTCIAMALGRPVQSLGLDLTKPFHPLTLGYWLASQWGIWLRPCLPGEPLLHRAVYICGIRSLNTVGVDHSVLLDTRHGEYAEGRSPRPDDRQGWKFYDPNMGRGEAIKFVDWVDQCCMLDRVELIDYHKRGDPTLDEPQEE